MAEVRQAQQLAAPPEDALMLFPTAKKWVLPLFPSLVTAVGLKKGSVKTPMPTISTVLQNVEISRPLASEGDFQGLLHVRRVRNTLTQQKVDRRNDGDGVSASTTSNSGNANPNTAVTDLTDRVVDLTCKGRGQPRKHKNGAGGTDGADAAVDLTTQDARTTHGAKSVAQHVESVESAPEVVLHAGFYASVPQSRLDEFNRAPVCQRALQNMVASAHPLEEGQVLALLNKAVLMHGTVKPEARRRDLWSQQALPLRFADCLRYENAADAVDDFKAWLTDWKNALAPGDDGGGGRHSGNRNSSSRWSSDDDEDETLVTTYFVSGAIGSGKTALVAALARDHDFDVIEVSSASTRSGAVLSRILTEATQSKSVQMRGQVGSCAPKVRRSRKAKPRNKHRGMKQNLIFIDEVDIVFPQDVGFYSFIRSLADATRCPIVMTCNSIPRELQTLVDSNHLRLPSLHSAQLVAWIQSVSLMHGATVSFSTARRLVTSLGCDIRSIFAQLQFWIGVSPYRLHGQAARDAWALQNTARKAADAATASGTPEAAATSFFAAKAAATVPTMGSADAATAFLSVQALTSLHVDEKVEAETEAKAQAKALAAEAAERDTYKTKKKDTLLSIAAQFAIEPKELIRINAKFHTLKMTTKTRFSAGATVFLSESAADACREANRYIPPQERAKAAAAAADVSDSFGCALECTTAAIDADDFSAMAVWNFVGDECMTQGDAVNVDAHHVPPGPRAGQIVSCSPRSAPSNGTTTRVTFTGRFVRPDPLKSTAGSSESNQDEDWEIADAKDYDVYALFSGALRGRVVSMSPKTVIVDVQHTLSPTSVPTRCYCSPFVVVVNSIRSEPFFGFFFDPPNTVRKYFSVNRKRKASKLPNPASGDDAFLEDEVEDSDADDFEDSPPVKRPAGAATGRIQPRKRRQRRNQIRDEDDPDDADDVSTSSTTKAAGSKGVENSTESQLKSDICGSEGVATCKVSAKIPDSESVADGIHEACSLTSLGSSTVHTGLSVVTKNTGDGPPAQKRARPALDTTSNDRRGEVGTAPEAVAASSTAKPAIKAAEMTATQDRNLASTTPPVVAAPTTSLPTARLISPVCFSGKRLCGTEDSADSNLRTIAGAAECSSMLDALGSQTDEDAGCPRVDGDEAEWQFHMVPRSSAIAEEIAQIQLSLVGKCWRKDSCGASLASQVPQFTVAHEGIFAIRRMAVRTCRKQVLLAETYSHIAKEHCFERSIAMQNKALGFPCVSSDRVLETVSLTAALVEADAIAAVQGSSGRRSRRRRRSYLDLHNIEIGKPHQELLENSCGFDSREEFDYVAID